ncbi:NAD(P)-binding domain,Short-chain dehydrogenase/reductase SDR [Cinara cedri]|uniref:Short-chain dehydrogenase/reductase 3 n=1 Tax=Cinara cedri TaxID=506608 RepID=A0A5E4NH54_9HEMI|nr:NAD(P)-binding domain,Short-chain dehydrogenase/reductase SDR [Cinara cedri]
MADPTGLPAEPLKFLVEIAVFAALLVPGILLAGLRKLLPARRKSVAGQVVLITGAARGLGRHLALKFSKLNAKIVCVDVDEEGNDETARLIQEAGGTAISYRCDVSKRDQIRILHERVKEDVGPVDVLINNAGIVWGHVYVDPSKDQFIVDQINVNLLGQIWMNREILPSMMERNSGHIVAISSMSSLTGVPNITTYTTSKWGINGMMESLDNELKEFNSAVKTSTVLPYFVKTNPKVSALLDIRFPELSVDSAGDIIVKGILEEKRIFSVPGHMLFGFSLVRLLPDNLQTLFKNIFYVNILTEPSADPIINKYKRKIA